MLPDGLVIPDLKEPYKTALASCLTDIFGRYNVIELIAAGTVVRGGGDPRSDLDIHVFHSDNFRERVQIFYNGVPCEVFVNPPYRVYGYFEEDKATRRPIAPHMIATGVVVYDATGDVAKLVAAAKAILDDVPPAPPAFPSTLGLYGAATEFEDVDDLALRDVPAAAVLLGSVVRRLAECRVAHEPGWLPRAKDLMIRLREVDPVAASLAEDAAADRPFHERLESARKLCIQVTGFDGTFEWSSPREELVPETNN